ncbi:MAG: hypothetical protein ACNA8L_02730 [Luteolibacter sp.]
MKTKSIATLLTAAFTLVFAVSASAAPPGKGLRLGGPSIKKSDNAPKVECRIGEKPSERLLKRTGPPGKGRIVRR